MSSTINKVLIAGIAALASFGTKKGVNAAWKKSAGHKPPTLDDTDAKLVEVIAFAVISTLIVTTVQVIVQRSIKDFLETPAQEIDIDEAQ